MILFNFQKVDVTTAIHRTAYRGFFREIMVCTLGSPETSLFSKTAPPILTKFYMSIETVDTDIVLKI